MRGAIHLPKFSVVVWVRKTGDYPDLRERLLEVAGDDPDESTEYQGMVDFHWGFDAMADADALADGLRAITERPEIVVLRIQSRDDAAPSRTLKDERYAWT